MSHDVPPAIVRDLCADDQRTEVIYTPYDGVSHTRGFGDSGYRVEVVEHDCPACEFDRMVRRVDVSPESRNEVRYWCLDPNCPHFVRDTLSYACQNNYPQNPARSPAVVDNGSP